ncbi:MAG: hypothetical protein R3C55_09635 [Parvularculaceae bacterium]
MKGWRALTEAGAYHSWDFAALVDLGEEAGSAAKVAGDGRCVWLHSSAAALALQDED